MDWCYGFRDASSVSRFVGSASRPSMVSRAGCFKAAFSARLDPHLLFRLHWLSPRPPRLLGSRKTSADSLLVRRPPFVRMEKRQYLRTNIADLASFKAELHTHTLSTAAHPNMRRLISVLSMRISSCAPVMSPEFSCARRMRYGSTSWIGPYGTYLNTL
jgi:hypothetical protein